MTRRVFVGIDLGTSNCKLSYIDRRLDVTSGSTQELQIPQYLDGRQWTEMGIPYLPSAVYFERENLALVGQYAAREMLLRSPERTVRAIKRQMGRMWIYEPFKGVSWTPQGISAILLRKIKAATEDALKETVTAAVITVPASFDSRQREATLGAAQLAGFRRDQIALLDEPSAAILDFANEQLRRRVSYLDFDQPRIILVFDIGGGTLDVSIVRTEPIGRRLKLQIVARSRYTELAGYDFSLRICVYLLNIFERECGVSLADMETRRQRAVLSRLMGIAEDLMKAISSRLRESLVYLDDLSRLDDSEVYVDLEPQEIYDGEDVIGVLPKLRLGYHQPFERLWAPFLDRAPERVSTIYAPIRSALAEAFPDDSQPEARVDLVLQHGGMCMLPAIEAALRAYFPEHVRVMQTPDVMQSVANGAAIYDAMRGSSEPGIFADIQMDTQPIFEAVYLERYHEGLQEVVPKAAVPGQTGEYEIEVPDGAPSRLLLSLYHGFRSDDPFVTLDREVAVQFERPPRKGDKVHLGWRIKPNRDVEYWWRMEGGEPRELVSLSTRGADLTTAVSLSSQQNQLQQLQIE